MDTNFYKKKKHYLRVFVCICGEGEEMKKQKEYYFRVWIFRFYLVIEPDEVLPFVEFAVAVETKKMREWMRKR